MVEPSLKFKVHKIRTYLASGDSISGLEGLKGQLASSLKEGGRVKLCPFSTVSCTWVEPSLMFKVHKIRTYLASGDSISGLEGLKGQLASSLKEGWRAKLCPFSTVSCTWVEPSLKFNVHKIRTYLASGDSISGLEGLKGQLASSLKEGWRAKLCPFSTVSCTWDESSLKFKVHKIRTYLASGDSNSGLEGLKGQLVSSLKEGWRAKLCPFSTVSCT